jgi:hypothetical protein
MNHFIHQIQMHNGIQAAVHLTGIITPEDAQRAVNVQLIRKLGFLITTGAPQLLLDQARNVICWQIPFLVQPPIDARGLYPTGEYALVNAYSGTYTLDDEAVHRINLAAIPIIQKLYPDMDAYLRKLKDG